MNRIMLLTIFILILTARICIGCGEGYPSSPQEVVGCFLEEDFTRAPHYWERISKFTTWTDSPGWDMIILVSGYTLGPSSVGTSMAEVVVEYINPVQYASDGSDVSYLGKSERVTFTVIKEGNCWKIQNPQNPPHLNASYIINDLRRQRYSGNAANILQQLEHYYE